jgi:hypothetical protein
VSGRTNFWPKDAAWWGRSRIIKAGREHGPLAPAVLDFIICEAKAQNPSASEEGWVKVGYEAIAYRATFGTSDVVRIRPVVSTLVRVGLLDDFEEDPNDDDVFTCRISGWREDVFLPFEAARKAQARNRQKPAKKPKMDDPESSEESGSSGDVRKRPETSLNPTQPKGKKDDDDARASARNQLPLFDRVMDCLSQVEDLLPVRTDDAGVLSEFQAAQDAGDDPLEIAELTVAAVRDYHQRNALNARTISSMMRGVRLRRSRERSAELRLAGDTARTSAGRSPISEAERLAAEAEAEADRLEREQAA